MRIVKIEENELIFDNGNCISADHVRDCCEWNYADFPQLDDEARAYDYDEDISFEEVENCGFRFGDSRRKFFVPCYSEQNGYYSSDLDITYSDSHGHIINTFNINCEWVDC